MSDLDAALLDAHARRDHCGLVGLYAQAAVEMPPDAAAFFLTQAWVFALETGDPRADGLQAALAKQGRA